MAYKNEKGANYEREIGRELTLWLKDLCGAEFVRRGGQEKQKWAWRGDVICKKKYICGDKCFLKRIFDRAIFIEVFNRQNPNLIQKYSKAIDDAEGGVPIIFWKKSKKGSSIEGVILTKQGFKTLLYVAMAYYKEKDKI